MRTPIISTTSELIGKRYRLVDQIGQGGMGSVYRATDRLTGQTVALKRVTAPTDQLVFASRTDASFDLRLSLAHEFRTLASLRHPNIISVLDYGFDDQRQPYFTMDILEDARTILDTGRTKPFDVQIDLITQMLQALAYLHRRGILHRDLKPGNVLVEGGRVKVLDFGLAISRKESGGTTSGTIAYMAPEVLDGKLATEKADLYASGVIAYELLAWKHPFHTENLIGLIDEIQKAIPDMQPVIEANPGVAPVIERLLA